MEQKRDRMALQYTDERIPERTGQGGGNSRSVFGAKTASVYDGPDDAPGSRWKLITQEELFRGRVQEPARAGEPDQDGRFASLLRMIRHYQVTDRGRSSSFLEQAKLMEDYEEDGYIFDITFYHQYAGYQEMDARELHGYFSWRSRFRRDEKVSYCFEYIRLHAAELVNLIGVKDRTDAFARLLKLQAIRPSGRLPVIPAVPEKSMQKILAGFVISWAADLNELAQAYCITDMEREAENTTLLHLEDSNDAAVFRMIRSLSSNRSLGSAFWKEAGEDGQHVLARVFRSVCRIQKQAGSPVLAEQLLGERRTLPAELFPMIPYETRVPDGYEIEVSPVTSYSFQNGYWFRSDYPLIRDDAAVRELNAVVRECERVLRRKMHYRNQLQNRMHNPALEQVISEEFERWMKEKAQRMRTEVRVDLSRLGTIRELAALTRERLLEGTQEGLEADALAAEVMMNDPDRDHADEDEAPSGEGLFNDQESAFLRKLLEGDNGADFFRDHRILPAVFVDTLNEKAFDEIGDSIVEEDSAGWMLVEDYTGDVRALLNRYENES